MAKFHFKYGAMNSGKSDSLMKTAHNYEERGLQVVTIKPSIDTKGGDSIVARAGLKRKADILAHPNDNLLDMITARAAVNCVLVDEAELLSEEQISQLYRVAKHQDISVICYGLRADFRNTLFAGSKRLFELADNIEKLPTMCFCGRQAEFNTRKIDGEYVFAGDQVAIEQGQVTYDSLCGDCYMRAGGAI